MYFLSSSIGDNVISALSSNGLWTAVCKSVIIILIGFFLTKAKILPENTGKSLTKVVMTIALPCLAFSSFMTSISTATFQSAIVSFIYGFVVYILFIFLSKLIFLPVKNPTKRIVLEVLFTFGSTTFFGQPLISAVFPSAINDSNMFNVAYRVFLYSYAYYAICQNKDESEEHEKMTWASFKKILKKKKKLCIFNKATFTRSFKDVELLFLIKTD